MKFHFAGVNFSARTGPNVFATRLAKAFIESGHDIVTFGPEADVSIVFIQNTGEPLAKRIIHRLDGIWFKPEQFKTHNILIKHAYEIADAVVWQSNFDKEMTTKWWGHPKNGFVVHNGISTPPCTDLTYDELIKIRQKHDLVFVCSANWHAQKRLRANIELFNHLRSLTPDSCLLVLGNSPDVQVPSGQGVIYVGSQPEDIYTQIYAMSDWMLHLAWLDHCPNVVVEAINQGTPVIHSSDGGTREIVTGFGIEVKETTPYDYALVDYDNPPKLNIENVTLQPKELLSHPYDVSMKRCMNEYLQVAHSII